MSFSAARTTQFWRALLVCTLVLGSLLTARQALAIAEGDGAPDISLTDLSGKPVSLAALKGKVVLVDFWASWCKPCREELPVLEGLQKKYGAQGLVIIGVNVDKDAGVAKKFLEDNKLNLSFTLANDAQHKVAASYAPPTMPSSYLVGRDGKVRFVHAGFRASDAKSMETEIQTLLR